MRQDADGASPGGPASEMSNVNVKQESDCATDGGSSDFRGQTTPIPSQQQAPQQAPTVNKQCNNAEVSQRSNRVPTHSGAIFNRFSRFFFVSVHAAAKSNLCFFDKSGKFGSRSRAERTIFVDYCVSLCPARDEEVSRGKRMNPVFFF